MKSKIVTTYKSLDTEEWLDIYFTRPIGYVWAIFFQKAGVTPNAVTIISMLLGAAAGVMFYYTDLLHNVMGIFLLMWANFLDSADGQLARMTGTTSAWGRFLDGFAGDVWFVSIYFFICLRLFPQQIPFLSLHWGVAIFFVAFFSGVFCHARQCQLADYYRNIHLYFLKGSKNSEFSTSEEQKRILKETPKKNNFWWRSFLKEYVRYVQKQERQTPHFQELFKFVNKELDETSFSSFSVAFVRQSRPLMKYANMITFNLRAVTLYLTCLVDMPYMYFIFEIFIFSSIAIYVRRRHERICASFLSALQKGVNGI